MVAPPTVPPPPALFSTMIGWPRCFEAASANARSVMSVEPPAAHGTISVIGRVGKSCARAAPDAVIRESAATTVLMVFMFSIFPLI